ncbi:MAG: deoxyribonuclease IV [Candidatus Omnitrophota bacterium]
MYLGVHVSISGKIYESIDRAEALGCTAMQIFSRNPRQWRQHSVTKEDALEFRRRRKASGVKVVAVHIPYLLNLATTRESLFQKSIEAYVADLKESSLLGADYLVTHMGSFKDSTLALGLSQFVKALNIVFKESKDTADVKLLLENTAGSGHWLGAVFEHHKYIFENVKESQRLGVCLDTAHAFAAGWNIRNARDFDALLNYIDRCVGKKALRLVHLNDSKSTLCSHADRHTHIGKGHIGIKGFKHIVNHPRLKDMAFVLETPKDEPLDDKMNLDRVRRLVSQKSAMGL